MLVRVVDTSRAASAAADAAAAACYTATEVAFCLLYVSEYGVLLLAIHTPERLAAACYLLWSFLTKYKTCQET